jgi:DNA-binding CsgD family transcriptional regulator
MTGELVPLSDREREVLDLVATGATNQQIARELVISPNTVKVHLRNIFEKLGVQSRTEATTEAIRRGLVSVAPGGGNSEVLPPELFTVSEQASARGNGVDGVAAPVSEPVLDWLPEHRERRPVAGWQRIYTVVALVLVLVGALAPGWWQARSQAAPATLFSDAGRPAGVSPQRVEVARWSAGAALPQGRSRLALVAHVSLLYAIGGETADGVTNSVTVYDPRENAWRAGPPKPTAVANIAGVALDDLIFVPGGSAGEGVSNALEVFDTKTEIWETRTGLPVPLAAYGLAAAGGKLYLSGGWDGSNYRAETYIYDPASDSWTSGPSLPSPRAFHSASALKGVVYVVGGYDGRSELDALLSYKPGEDTRWTARAHMEAPRAGFGLAALGTRLYVVGGGWRVVEFNEQYDTQVDAWSRFGGPSTGTWRSLGLTGLDQKIYAVGGWNNGYLTVNEQYQALLRQLLPLGGRGGG